MLIKRITYKDYLDNGKKSHPVLDEQGQPTGESYVIHTEDTPPISEAEWNSLYGGDVVIPGPSDTVEDEQGRVSKLDLPRAVLTQYESISDKEGQKLCDATELRMQKISA